MLTLVLSVQICGSIIWTQLWLCVFAICVSTTAVQIFEILKINWLPDLKIQYLIVFGYLIPLKSTCILSKIEAKNHFSTRRVAIDVGKRNVENPKIDLSGQLPTVVYSLEWASPNTRWECGEAHSQGQFLSALYHRFLCSAGSHY